MTKKLPKNHELFGGGRDYYMPKLFRQTLRSISNGVSDNVGLRLTHDVRQALKISKKKYKNIWTGNRRYFEKELEWAWTSMKNYNLIEFETYAEGFTLTEAGKALAKVDSLKTFENIYQSSEVFEDYKDEGMTDAEAFAKAEELALGRVPRTGQTKFRQNVMELFDSRCAVSGLIMSPSACDACHIRDYARGGSFEVANGLFLRKDIHWLYDKGDLLIDADGIVTTSMPEYDLFNGQIDLPEITDRKLLDEKYQRFK